MDRGAHFHCCDLQVHSPRDENWVGDCPVTAEARRQFAKELIRSCREKGLDAIAITDHHDVAFVEYVREAAASERDAQDNPIPVQNQVVIFPGIELTLGTPHQAIVIFDPDTTQEALNKALTVLGIVPSSPADPKTAATVRLPAELNLNAIRDRFQAHPELFGKFILLPNVNAGGGDTILRNGFADHYKGMHCVGGYIDGGYAGHARRNIVEGKDPQWGGRAIGVIQTSDARRRDFATLGENPTWIKWSIPSAEALRQAALAPASRIRHSRPDEPRRWIRRMEVSASKFFGAFSVDFNPQSNMIIGGRGSGKSTVLEYLRWALADQSPTIPSDDPESADYEKRRRSLIASTLVPERATVSVEYVRDGVVHRVTRNGTNGALSLKIGDEPEQAVSESVVQTLVGIQGYSQKQLSHVSVRTGELVRLLTSPIANELKAKETQRDVIARELVQMFATDESRRSLSAQSRLSETELSSKQQRLDSLSRDAGELGADLRKQLDDHPLYRRGAILLSQFDHEVASAEQASQTLKAALQSAVDSLSSSNIAGDIVAPAEEVNALRHKIVAQLEQEVSRASEIEERLIRLRADGLEEAKPISEEIVRHEESYAAATSEHAAIQARLDSIRALSEEVSVATQSLAALQAQVNALGDTGARLSAAREAWRAALDEESTTLEREAASLTAAANDQLRARIRRRLDVNELRDRLQEAMRGAALTVPEKLERLLDQVVTSQDPLTAWLEIADELVSLSRTLQGGTTGDELPATQHLTGAGFIPSELRRIGARLSTAAAFQLSVLAPRDIPEFLYRNERDEHVPFDTASPGQQATALIALLMNQPGGPLVIDQPEDDLDNATIGKIAEQLWGAKERRQLIFVSHNPNLVVIGDAELVLHCDYHAGGAAAVKIATQGAIDAPSMNETISAVMEGGRKAFNLRRDKYGF